MACAAWRTAGVRRDPAPGPGAPETRTTRGAGPGTDPCGKLAARAGRLLRWYPRAWRARYGAEFTELLLADLAEEPRSWRRTADVAVNGTLARLSQAGLGGRLLDPAAQATASLASLAARLAMMVRRLALPAGVLRYHARLGSAAAATMAAFLTGTACWVLAGGPGPRVLFRAGAVDGLALAVMALALAVGWRALHRAHTAGLPGHPAARRTRPACSPAAQP